MARNVEAYSTMTFWRGVELLNSIQWVSKNPKGKDVLPTYEYLCDIAHPSFIGNTRFWSHIEEVLPDSSERRVISKYADRETTFAIVDKILWSLGWSAAVLRNGFEITKVGLAQVLTKLDDGEQSA